MHERRPTLTHCAPRRRRGRAALLALASIVGAATATCSKRKRLAFGGFQGDVDITDFDPITFPHAMRRSSKRSWTAVGANLAAGGPAGPSAGDVTAYAYCGKPK